MKEAIAKVIETYGKIDAAFNNAGIMQPLKDITDIPVEDYDKVMNINLKGVWLCMKHELIQMKKQGSGAIVNNSSLAGKVASPGRTPYSAAKFAIVGITASADLAYEAMSKTTQPSFGWWVKNGNTTSWEGWSRPGSGNHPMFGGGLVWLYRKLAGMNADPTQPGYKNIIFKPQPVPDLDYVSYENLTPYGMAGIRWDNAQESFRMKINVPIGSTATVYIPFAKGSKVLENNVP